MSYNQNSTLLADDHVLSYTDLFFLSLYITKILSVGVSLSFLIVGYYMKGSFFIVRDSYIDRIKDKDKEEGDDEDDKKYYKELNKMSYINKSLLDVNGLYNLRFKTVREQSPDGDDIIMTYNSDTGTFWYYCDNKENIKFNTLDSTARKFAIENNCKCVCVNYKEELDKAIHAIEYSVVLKQLKDSWTKGTTDTDTNKSVYAAFKKYNDTNTHNHNDAGSVKKHITNRFSYKGKLSEYKPFEEKTSPIINKDISFAHFKQILKEKENGNEQESASGTSNKIIYD